jgi:hypothetical protein
MGEKPQDLKPRTKTFALRIICLYSKLPRNDTVAQVLGNLCGKLPFKLPIIFPFALFERNFLWLTTTCAD